jgi:hypothetical protein
LAGWLAEAGEAAGLLPYLGFWGVRNFCTIYAHLCIPKSVSISPISLPYFIRGFPTFLQEKNRIHENGSGILEAVASGFRGRMNRGLRGFARIGRMVGGGCSACRVIAVIVALGVTVIVSNDVCVIFKLKSVPISPISLPYFIRGFFTFPKEKAPRIQKSWSGILDAMASASRRRMNRGFSRVYADWRDGGRRLVSLPGYICYGSFGGNSNCFR